MKALVYYLTTKIVFEYALSSGYKYIVTSVGESCTVCDSSALDLCLVSTDGLLFGNIPNHHTEIYHQIDCH